jgi:hypothetical protein
MDNKFHPEWLTEHPEALVRRADVGRTTQFNVLSRLADGSYTEDLFVGQLRRVCDFYGFDGWHGPDGYGPLSSPIHLGDVSDGMIDQFAAGADGLPPEVTEGCGDDVERLSARAEWIWANRRLEWIEFWSTRWATFWGKVSAGMHADGRRAYVNSAWTRDPFEALYRYGVDYRKLADAGIDGIVAETVAGSIMLGSGDRDYHYDYLAMLMLIRAYAPDIELIFLHPIKDVVEDWDLLRHAPAMLEREIYALGNVFHTRSDGSLSRSVDGFLGCLGDGITPEEWSWLRDRWDLSFTPPPKRVVGATLVWSDAAMQGHVHAFPRTRDWSAHRIAHRLMAVNGPVQATIRIEDVHHATGPLLVVNPHLFPAQQQRALFDCGQPLIVLGPDFASWPEADQRWCDGEAERALELRLYGSSVTVEPELLPQPGDNDDFTPPETEPTGFRDELVFRPVSPEFVQLAAAVVRAVSGACSVRAHATHVISDARVQVGAMSVEQADGSVRLGLKNSSMLYSAVDVTMPAPVQSVDVRTIFPATTVYPSGDTFMVKLPPRGIVVVDVHLGGRG